jgi:hypothetical protein
VLRSDLCPIELASDLAASKDMLEETESGDRNLCRSSGELATCGEGETCNEVETAEAGDDTSLFGA